MINYSQISDDSYQLLNTYVLKTHIFPKQEIEVDYATLKTDGRLFIRKGFAWDGDTWAWNFKCSRRASLVHDVFCIMVGEGLLSDDWMDEINDLYMDICIKDGMWKFWAKVRRRALRRYWGV